MGHRPPKWEDDDFRHGIVSSAVAFSSARQTGRYSIPIALPPAQFNEFYRQCSRRPSQCFRGSLPVSTPDRILFIIAARKTAFAGAAHSEVGPSVTRTLS